MCRRSAEATVGRLMTENMNQMEATQKRSGVVLISGNDSLRPNSQTAIAF